MRWQGSEGVRTEGLSLGATCPPPEDASAHLQKAVLRLAVLFDIALPPEFFLPPVKSFAGYMEKQTINCANEWRNVVHKEEEFQESEQMKRTGSKVLARVPGCFVRLSPIALGVAGVTSPDVIHAMLLCAEGKEGAALTYAKTYREGLRPPDGEDSALDMHTVAIQTEPVFLNGMISLYAHGGKSGEPLKKTGNWVYKTTAAIVPVNTLCDKFFVMSCDMDSVVPENSALVKYMDSHTKKSIELFQRTFGGQAPRPPPAVAQPEVDKMPPEDRFVLAAIGFDIDSSRMLIGEAIAFLLRSGAESNLVALLASTADRIGLTASLSEAYSHCVEIYKDDKRKRDEHSAEVSRLKRVADAALLLGANKRACVGLDCIKPEKVRSLMSVFSLKAGPSAKVGDVMTTPRSEPTIHSLSTVVYQSHFRRLEHERPEVENLDVVLRHYRDPVLALAKCMYLCALQPGARTEAFIVAHASSTQYVSVYRVTEEGGAEACGVGKVFEADAPALLVLKFKSANLCIVTPMVKE